MNRDTIYSIGVFDLGEPLTVTLPEAGDRYMSMMLVNQDHSISGPIYEPGIYTFTEQAIGTRYLFIILRVFVDANDPDDIERANAVQDRVAVEQADPGEFGVPDWDMASLLRMRDAINVLASSKSDIRDFFGDKSTIDPIDHLLGTAYGWGGCHRKLPSTLTSCRQRITVKRPIR